ncbi:MAG: DUF2336 domain-containing protein [Caulobacterales bacterium]
MTTASHFARLVDLAKEPSSEKRRELLREVTEMFFVVPVAQGGAEQALFDDVLQRVAQGMQDSVLAELSARFADAPNAPVGLMRDLANRAFVIADPVLTRSKALREQDLVAIVSRQSQDHIRAVAQRDDVTEVVSSAIVSKGNDAALDTLMRNARAMVSRESMESVVDRARLNAALHDSVVNRADMPLDLMNEMYFVVAERLRSKILERNTTVDPATLDEALERARRRMSQAAAKPDPDWQAAGQEIAQKLRKGQLDGRLLVSYYREHKLVHFIIGLAEITGVDVATAQGVIERQDMDALAMICRAAAMERPLFVTIAVLACGGDRAMSKAEEFGKMYSAVPQEAAQRAMRFFKVRKTSLTGTSAAA